MTYSLSSYAEPKTVPTSFEVIHLSARSSTKHNYIFVVYRPPERTDHPSFSVFGAEICLLLESSIDINEDLVIVGDFDIVVDCPFNSRGTTFNQLLEVMVWTQLVNGRVSFFNCFLACSSFSSFFHDKVEIISTTLAIYLDLGVFLGKLGVQQIPEGPEVV